MKYWYDCEFLENGKTIELISIGIVAVCQPHIQAHQRFLDWVVSARAT